MKSLKLLLIGLPVGMLFIGLSLGVAAEAPGDIVFTREGGAGAFSPAYFPHWIHRIRFKCYACHDGIFKMKRGSNPMSMDTMMEGKSCGVCHNGKVAWPITMDTCNRCHVSR